MAGSPVWRQVSGRNHRACISKQVGASSNQSPPPWPCAPPSGGEGWREASSSKVWAKISYDYLIISSTVLILDNYEEFLRNSPAANPLGMMRLSRFLISGRFDEGDPIPPSPTDFAGPGMLTDHLEGSRWPPPRAARCWLDERVGSDCLPSLGEVKIMARSPCR